MNERIEKYYSKKLTPLEKEEFEKNLIHDLQLAEEMAFYLQTKQLLKEEILAKRHAEWQRMAKPIHIQRSLRPWYYAAAAIVVLALGIGWYFLLSTNTANPQQMAAIYIENNLSNLPTQMDGQKDSLQTAIGYYNEAHFADAQKWSESLLSRNPDNAEVLKVAGLASLQSKDYNQALAHFHHLAGLTDMVENHGKFYEALVYLHRNEPLDKITADSLLNVVIMNNLDGKEEAEKWVEKK